MLSLFLFDYLFFLLLLLEMTFSLMHIEFSTSKNEPDKFTTEN